MLWQCPPLLGMGHHHHPLSWALGHCLQSPAPHSIPLALLVHPPCGKPHTFLLSDLEFPGFGHSPQGTSTGSCPHGAGHGLCMGKGTGSTLHRGGHRQCSMREMALAALGMVRDTGGSAWGGCWQCCAQGCHPAVPSLCAVCIGNNQARTTPPGLHMQEQAPGGPICFWIRSQWLLAQGGQMKALLNSGSSAGLHRVY